MQIRDRPSTLAAWLIPCLALLACNPGDKSDGSSGGDCESLTWYQDADGDGYGVPDASTVGCDPGDGWADNAGDCDDGDASRFPDGTWEGTFPEDWTDPIDWEALCAECVDEVDGDLFASVGPGAHYGGDGAGSATAFACIERVTGNAFVSTTLTDVDGLEQLSSVGGALYVESASLSDLDGLSGLTEVGSLALTLSSPSAPDLSGISGLFSMGTLPGSLSLSLAAGDLDALSDLQEVTGNVSIQGDLDDLRGLSGLTRVGGNLLLDQLDVPSLDGLDALVDVGGSLQISDVSITDLDGLGAAEVGGSVQIRDNTELITLSGLEAITATELSVTGNPVLAELAPLTDATIGAGLYLAENPALEDVDELIGLSDLSSAVIEITSNDALANLDGLSSLTRVDHLTVSHNDELQDLGGLGALEQVGSNLIIEENHALPNLDGLSALTTVDGDLSIVQNSSLEDLDGLSALTTLTHLYIEDNERLTHLDGLANLAWAESIIIAENGGLSDISGISGALFSSLELRSIYRVETITGFDSAELSGASIALEGVGDLTTLDAFNGMTTAGSLFFGNMDAPAEIGGFSSLTRIEGNLSFQESTDLADITGFAALESVGRSVYIGTNEGGPVDIGGLGALTDIGDSLTISDNFDLVDISGLESLSTVGGRLELSGNPSLCTSVAEALADRVSVGGTAVTSDNDDGC